MGFSSEAHLDRLCNTLCGCEVGSGEERGRERETRGEWASLCGENKRPKLANGGIR